MNHSFGRDVDLFIQGVSSLSITLPLVKSILQVTGEKAQKDLETFMQMKAEIVDDDAEKHKQTFRVDVEYVTEFMQIRRNHEAARIANEVIPQSFVVALVSQFDVHVGRLIRTMFYIKPEKLNASHKNLTFPELLSFNSVDDAREFIIEKEIEAVLRESHSEQFKWLEAQLGIALRKDLAVWPDFIEVTERRNLFVHTDGVISSQYITVCKENGVPASADIKVGKKLPVTLDYFQCAYNCIFEIGVKLAHVMWRKLNPSDREQADENLNQIGYDLIVSESYDAAINILEFATNTLKTHFSDDARLKMVVNLAQAYKWNGDNDKCRLILGKIDWSALEPKYKLADAVLQDNFDLAAKFMRRIGDSGEILKSQYRDWPLFKKFRLADEFRKAYRDIFGEDFASSEQEISSDEGGALNLEPSES